jgi:hypothetical protein
VYGKLRAERAASVAASAERKEDTMPEPDAEARKAPNSLTPIQLEGAGYDEDLAKFRSGRGLRLGVMFVVLAAAGIGIVQLLRTMDTRQSYAQAASQLEGSDSEQREAFLHCALPNVTRTQLTSPDALRTAIESVSGRMEKGYGRVLSTCTPLLASFEQAIKDIKAPADVKPRVEAVSSAATDFGKAWSTYKDYLQGPGETYEPAQAAPFIEKITSTWQSYETAREQAKNALTAKR